MMVVVGMVGASHANGEPGLKTQGMARDSLHTKSFHQEPNPTYQMWELVRKGDSKRIQTLFRSLDDGLGKMKLASELMQLGVRDVEYFHYLAESAQKPIVRNVPFPMKFDKEGKFIRGEMNEAFLAWCGTQNVDAKTMASTLIYKDPIPVLLLADSGDPRALPLLLRGLASPNFYVVAVAARGLGIIGDSHAIDPVVQAVLRAPEEMRSLIARELGYFEHPEAQAALERFIKDTQLRQSYMAAARVEKARRKKSRAFVFGDSPIPKQ